MTMRNERSVLEAASPCKPRRARIFAHGTTMKRADCRVGPTMEPAFRPVPLSLFSKERAERSGNFFAGGWWEWTIAGRIDAVTLSCLETGAFQLILRLKSAFLSIASPPPRIRNVKKNRGRGGENPASPGTFSRRLRTFDASVYMRERVRVLRKRFFSQRGQRLCIVCLGVLYVSGPDPKPSLLIAYSLPALHLELIGYRL